MRDYAQIDGWAFLRDAEGSGPLGDTSQEAMRRVTAPKIAELPLEGPTPLYEFRKEELQARLERERQGLETLESIREEDPPLDDPNILPPEALTRYLLYIAVEGQYDISESQQHLP